MAEYLHGTLARSNKIASHYFSRRLQPYRVKQDAQEFGPLRRKYNIIPFLLGLFPFVFLSSQNSSYLLNLIECHLTDKFNSVTRNLVCKMEHIYAEQPQPGVIELTESTPAWETQHLVVRQKPAVRQYTNAEWETKRDIIKRLYVDEKRPLNVVMETMETEHQFKAT